MSEGIYIYKVYPESFRANEYTTDHFRMIGLIDVSINFKEGMELVTLAFYRSSGTNSGKIQGLWYPIVGIKLVTGGFTEFTPYINMVLTEETRSGGANSGWLAKSIFFSHRNKVNSLRGFSSGKHYSALLEIGETLRELYDKDNYVVDKTLTPEKLNKIIYSSEVYSENKYSQFDNFEEFIEDIIKNM